MTDTVAPGKPAEDPAAETERLLLLGRLAPAVVHEVNTLVGIALTSASLSREKLARVRQEHAAGTLTRQKFERFMDASDRVHAVLVQNLERCGQLIGAFRQVSVDQGSGAVRRVGMAKLVDDTVSSLHPFLRKIDHEVVVDCPADLTVEADPGLLARVLINLILNSVYHAGGGAKGPHLTLRVKVALTHRGIAITYSDDGRGIPDHLQERVFEPYFTTRGGEGGSGLGLPIIRDIVEKTFAGTLTLTSAEGRGVRFDLDLPMKTFPGDRHE